MLDIILSSIEAYGGLSRWKTIRQISATLSPGGAALKLRGQEAFASQQTRMTVDTRLQRVKFDPFLAPGQVGVYTPFRTAVETTHGVVLEGLDNPRQSFTFDGAPWTAPQLAYFAGYAMWTYFTLPFSLLTSGVRCIELEPWIDHGEIWKRVEVTFPESYVTHSRVQILYFDATGLIRRHDYAVDIAGGGPAAHYLYEQQTFEGIVFPTRRRIYPRGPDGHPNKDLVLMAADLVDFTFVEESGPVEKWSTDACD